MLISHLHGVSRSTFSPDSQPLALAFQCNKVLAQSQLQVKQNTGQTHGSP